MADIILTPEDYIKELDDQRKTLARNLMEKGIGAEENEKYNALISKVLDFKRGAPIEVEELPAVGVEGTFYKTVEKKEGADQLWLFINGQGSLNMSEEGFYGTPIVVIIVEDYPENPIISTEDTGLYIYYVLSMNNLYATMDGIEWNNFGELLGVSCQGIVSSTDEFTADGLYVIPGNVTITTNYLFENDKYIVVGDDNYRAIADTIAFPAKSCKIVIPETWNTIPDYAFDQVTGLSSVIIHKDITSIGAQAFYDCSNMTKIVFEEGNQLTSIGRDAFSSCESLSNIEIPDSVTSIGQFAFSGSALKSVKIPDGVTVIEEGLFRSCRYLEEVVIPDSVTIIGSDAFEGTALKSVKIPDGITSIDAFSRCTYLEEVILPSSITTIERHAFSHCTALKEIIIPNNVTHIGDWAFYNSGLTVITLQSTTPPKLSYESFKDCNALTEIRVPMSAVDTYKSAANWSDYANKIVGYE